MGKVKVGTEHRKGTRINSKSINTNNNNEQQQSPINNTQRMSVNVKATE